MATKKEVKSAGSRLSVTADSSTSRAPQTKDTASKVAKRAKTSKNNSKAQSKTASQTKSAADNKAKANSTAEVKSDDFIVTVDRYEKIAVAAYFLAEKRGFDVTDPVQNWVDAEREVLETESI